MPTRTDIDDARWLTSGLELHDSFRVLGALDRDAKGNWAVVVEAEARDAALATSHPRVALKIMRGRHLGNPRVYQQFGLEARLLRHREAKGSAARLLALGFLRDPDPGGGIDGSRFQLMDDVAAFIEALDLYCGEEWRPFLVLSPVPFQHTLLYRLFQLQSRAAPQLNALLPLPEVITITAQALEVLDECHQEHIYYRDHKPEHLIWHDQQVAFLDWNGGDWLDGPLKGSLPQSEAQVDIQNFIGYVAYPLFAACQINGEPIRAIQRGTAHPPPVAVADGEALPFYDADAWLDPVLKTILSRPFWSPAKRYGQAREMADALRTYLREWQVGGLANRLEQVLDEVATAQTHLRQARRRMKTLLRLIEQPQNANRPIRLEVRRVQKHLYRLIDQQLLPGDDLDT